MILGDKGDDNGPSNGGNGGGKTIASQVDVSGTDSGKLVKVGDYVSYEPNLGADFDWLKSDEGHTFQYFSGQDANTGTISPEDLKWRVFDVDSSGQLRLISERPTTGTVWLGGYQGYNNAVKLLDKIADTLFKGEKSSKVASIKIEDVTSKLIEFPPNPIPEIGFINFGRTDIAVSSGEHPKIFADERSQLGNSGTDGLDQSEQDKWYDGLSAPTRISGTSTCMNMPVSRKSFINANYSDTLSVQFAWMASRAACFFDTLNSPSANFNICEWSGSGINCGQLKPLYYVYKVPGTTNYASNSIYPVVTIKTEVLLGGGDGSIANPWELK